MALEAGVMHVTLEYGKDLKNRDWFSRQDPYCILQCGTQKFRSKTHVNGAKNPVWNQTFQFQVVNENNLQIMVYDEDRFTRDDVLGTAGVSFAKARQQGTDQVHAPVLSARGKQHGFIAISLRFEANNALRRQAAAAAQQFQTLFPQTMPTAPIPSAPPAPAYYVAPQQPQVYTPAPYPAYPQQFTPYQYQQPATTYTTYYQPQPLYR